jgi:predicted nucleic acid binding AN1-type Zn finger protein
MSLNSSQKLNRCCFEMCNSKLKLTDMKCRCEKYYCLKHRLPELHLCEYDYKKDKIQLEKVVCPKIIKI